MNRLFLGVFLCCFSATVSIFGAKASVFSRFFNKKNIDKKQTELIAQSEIEREVDAYTFHKRVYAQELTLLGLISEESKERITESHKLLYESGASGLAGEELSRCYQTYILMREAQARLHEKTNALSH